MRPWAHEFDTTNYNLAMSVIYTWYRTFDWYDFDDADFRWFYNMLQVAANAGQHKGDTPLLSFVHWHTTAAPSNPDPDVLQMSEAAYQEILWHTLLRGHDGLFLWCQSPELGKEIQLLHWVYSESLEYADILTDGAPLVFDVPGQPQPIVSAVINPDRILSRCTAFGSDTPVELEVDSRTLEVLPARGCQINELTQ